MSGNRTRGVCVTGRNVTNYTNTDALSSKKTKPVSHISNGDYQGARCT